MDDVVDYNKYKETITDLTLNFSNFNREGKLTNINDGLSKLKKLESVLNLNLNFYGN